MSRDQSNHLLDSLAAKATEARIEHSPLLVRLECNGKALYPRAIRSTLRYKYFIVSHDPPAGGIASVPGYCPEASVDFIINIDTTHYPWTWEVLKFRDRYFCASTGIQDTYAPPYAVVPKGDLNADPATA